MSDYALNLEALNRACLLISPELCVNVRTSRLQRLGDSFSWAEIRGISAFDREYSVNQVTGVMEKVLTGLSRALRSGADSLIFQLSGDGERVYVRLGFPKGLMGIVASSFRAMYPGIDFMASQVDPRHAIGAQSLYGGVLTGYPGYIPSEDYRGELPLDQLLRGIGKRPFAVTVIARPESAESTLLPMLSWLNGERKRAASDAERQLCQPGGVSEKRLNLEAREYQQLLETASELLNHARYSALWSVQTFYASPDVYAAAHLGGMLCAALNGDAPQPLEAVTCRALRAEDSQAANACQGLLRGQGLLYTKAFDCSLNPNEASNYMSSRELARLIALPRREYTGYYVDPYVQFDVDNRPGRRDGGAYVLGDIVRTCYPSAPAEGSYRTELDDLTRHALIVGLTGSGKTNTGKDLLKSLWEYHRVPFLVIESAKREYWELSRLLDEDGRPVFPALNVFTVGDENPDSASPFRLNPMETMPGVPLQTHIDYLMATFKAAFELYPPMPYVLETAVYKVYADRGWDIVTGRNRFGLNRYPMLEELKSAVEEVTDGLHYDSDVASNVKAALTARIHSLMNGSKSFMMNAPRSIEPSYLLSRPTVLELEDLGDDDTKAFVIGMLLVRIYEYRKATQFQVPDRPGGGKALSHVIMVEEAHRLLKNVQAGGEGNQTRANAVEFFCNMLAEIRSFGQAFFIADQVPTKLAPDTLKNTNLKIVHRTVMAEDREAVGRAMNMTEEQIEALSALRVGCAAVFSEGDSRPKLVRFPPVLNGDTPTRRALIAQSHARIRSECGDVFNPGKNTPACRWCDDCCAYHDAAVKLISGCGGMGRAMELVSAGNGGSWSEAFEMFFDAFCPDALRGVRLCAAGQLIARLEPNATARQVAIDALVEATVPAKSGSIRGMTSL